MSYNPYPLDYSPEYDNPIYDLSGWGCVVDVGDYRMIICNELSFYPPGTILWMKLKEPHFEAPTYADGTKQRRFSTKTARVFHGSVWCARSDFEGGIE